MKNSGMNKRVRETRDSSRTGGKKGEKKEKGVGDGKVKE